MAHLPGITGEWGGWDEDWLGIARAGIDALIELAGGKVPRGRTSPALLCDSAQVQEVVRTAGLDAHAGRIYRAAMIRELWTR